MSEKTIVDRIINLLLTLYIIDRVNQSFKMEDNLKLQKLVFLSQKDLNAAQRKGFRYPFFRWLKGPFSANLNEDLTLLKDANFVDWGADNIELTQEGANLLESTEEVFEFNPTFLKYINKVVDEYSHLSPEEIKNHVYNIRIWVPRLKKVMRIEEVPQKQIIMYELPKKRTRYAFIIGNEWLETLEVIFDLEAMDLLREANQDAIEGNVKVPNAV